MVLDPANVARADPQSPIFATIVDSEFIFPFLTVAAKAAFCE
jgi:hypothetical protein